MPRLLFVCVTCDRHARPRPPETRGRALADALRSRLAARGDAGLELREVACLNGCLKPCNVGLRAPGRQTLRVSLATCADADAILDLAARFWDGPPEGGTPLAPAPLEGRVSVMGAPGVRGRGPSGATARRDDS